MGNAYYTSEVIIDEKPQEVNFIIPVDDMGDADFTPVMRGKLLLRYLQKN